MWVGVRVGSVGYRERVRVGSRGEGRGVGGSEGGSGLQGESEGGEQGEGRE